MNPPAHEQLEEHHEEAFASREPKDIGILATMAVYVVMLAIIFGFVWWVA